MTPSESPRDSVRDAIWNRLTDWLPYADALDEKEINEKTDRLLSDLEPLLAEVDRLRAQVAAVERASDRIAVWGYKVDPVRIAQEIESALRGDRS